MMKDSTGSGVWCKGPEDNYCFSSRGLTESAVISILTDNHAACRSLAAAKKKKKIQNSREMCKQVHSPGKL